MLADDEPAPVEIVNREGRSPYLLVCDHAGRAVPRSLGGLGLSDDALSGHIGWDIGARAVALRMAELLDACLIMQCYSRLVIDCNRPPDDAQSIVAVSEQTPVPGNAEVSADDRARRVGSIYRPFHEAIDRQLDQRLAARRPTAVVSIHSFTPRYLGRDRPWHVGIVYDRDSRLADRLIADLEEDGRWQVGRNAPYSPADGVCHTLTTHAAARGLCHAMIEIRNDLVAEEAGQARWAVRLAAGLSAALPGLFDPPAMQDHAHA